MKNEKVILWKVKDYVRTIILFLINAFLIIGLFFLTFIMSNGVDTLSTIFSQANNGLESFYIPIAVVLLCFIMYIYFYIEKRDFLYKTSNIFMVFTILILSYLVCYGFGKINAYLRPFALCSLMFLFLVERRTAMFINGVFCILMLLADLFEVPLSSYTREIYISLIINFISGIFAVFMLDGEGSRIKLFSKGIVVSIPVIVSAICLEFSKGLNLIEIFLYALCSGPVATILMMVLISFLEAIFGRLTNFRLTELTDHKSKLIKLLIERAPGTFNHTVIVSTLAESCANAINENPLLARACAYYHDIGKVKKPEYFAENQSGKNLHDELSPELSTDIIRSHSKDGGDLIRRRRLPQVLADACEQHHGTMPIRYFYAKALKFTDGELSMDKFSYYGPKPKTKINAIIMICDACEAKVRTVSNRTHENVDKAVKEIIEERMDMDQFTDCDITLKELDIIRNTITNNLAGVYHERVKYPKLKAGNKNANQS